MDPRRHADHHPQPQRHSVRAAPSAMLMRSRSRFRPANTLALVSSKLYGCFPFCTHLSRLYPAHFKARAAILSVQSDLGGDQLTRSFHGHLGIASFEPLSDDIFSTGQAGVGKNSEKCYFVQSPNGLWSRFGFLLKTFGSMLRHVACSQAV